MAYAAAIAAGISAFSSMYGGRKRAKAARRRAQQLRQNAAKLYPHLFSALDRSQWGMGGSRQAFMSPEQLGQGSGGYMDYLSSFSLDPGAGREKVMDQLVNAPGYVDPRMMNMSLNLNQQQGRTNMQAFEGIVGRGGMEGGLADTYALANQAAVNTGRAQILQGYTQMTNEKRERDIQTVNDMLRDAYTMAGAQTSEIARYESQTPGWGEMIGQGIGTGLTAYGGMQQQGGQQGGQQGRAPTGPGQGGGQGGGFPNPYQPIGSQQISQPPPIYQSRRTPWGN